MKKEKSETKITKKKVKEIFSENIKVSSLEKKQEKKPKKERNIQKLALKFIEDPSENNFKELCERINWGLRSYIFKIVGDDEATTEVMSKTLENIYFKRDQFNPKIAQFSTWMYRIAFNNALKYTQAKTAHGITLGVDFEDLYDSTLTNDCEASIQTDSSVSSEPIEIVFKNGEYITYDRERVLSEFYDASVESIKDLPDNLRIVMYDRLINQKKIDDIAYDNNIPVSSVKNWLRKGKSELQEIIKTKHNGLYNMYMEMMVG